MLNNIKKTIAYARRNGITDAVMAAAERIHDQRADNYTYEPPAEEELEKQRKWYRALLNDAKKSKMLPLISIIVPCYNTDKEFLKAMIDSVIGQTYGKWELILAEAPVAVKRADGKTVHTYPLRDTIGEYHVRDGRVRYLHLKSNAGISENTNGALDIARGDYIALLDHDDLLTPDALCEVSIAAIKNYPRLIYSNEDKCDAEGKTFFQCHKKPSFNPDLFLSNNYICHFTTIRADVIFGCRFRSEYDGAQDYDLFLRAIGDTMWDTKNAKKQVVHIPKVLYHWRCHDNSTSANPASKEYAYKAGQNAVADFLKTHDIEADVEQLKHVGFYRVQYKDDIFSSRKDLGVIGGKLVDRNGAIVGGNYKENGNVRYDKLPKGFSGGYQHLAVLQQNAEAVDYRCMKIRPELYDLYRQTFDMTYSDTTNDDGKRVSFSKLTDEQEIRQKSIQFCKKVREMGYRVMWDPELVRTLNN